MRGFVPGEMRDGPADTVDQKARTTARDHLALIVLAEVEQLDDCIPDGRGAVLVAILMTSEDRAISVESPEQPPRL